MFDIVILVGVGAFIGWNVPQPAITKRAQDAVVNWFASLRT